MKLRDLPLYAYFKYTPFRKVLTLQKAGEESPGNLIYCISGEFRGKNFSKYYLAGDLEVEAFVHQTSIIFNDQKNDI